MPDYLRFYRRASFPENRKTMFPHDGRSSGRWQVGQSCRRDPSTPARAAHRYLVVLSDGFIGITSGSQWNWLSQAGVGTHLHLALSSNKPRLLVSQLQDSRDCWCLMRLTRLLVSPGLAHYGFYVIHSSPHLVAQGFSPSPSTGHSGDFGWRID